MCVPDSGEYEAVLIGNIERSDRDSVQNNTGPKMFPKQTSRLEIPSWHQSTALSHIPYRNHNVCSRGIHFSQIITLQKLTTKCLFFIAAAAVSHIIHRVKFLRLTLLQVSIHSHNSYQKIPSNSEYIYWRVSAYILAQIQNNKGHWSAGHKFYSALVSDTSLQNGVKSCSLEQINVRTEILAYQTCIPGTYTLQFLRFIDSLSLCMECGYEVR